MNLDITKLKSGIETVLPIDFNYSFSAEELKGTDLLKLDDVQIVGELTKDAMLSYFIHVSVTGTMVLPCAVTLKPVDYPFSIEIEGNLEELMKEINEFLRKNENTIDIFSIIWENILMEIPMRVVSENASLNKISGRGWQLITEEQESSGLNPELQKLEDLLK